MQCNVFLFKYLLVDFLVLLIIFCIFVPKDQPANLTTMKITITKKQWGISKKDLKTLSFQKIEEMLYSLNKMCSGCFYVGNYYHKKLIIDSPNALILCGYPKELAEQEGFDFFQKTLKKEEHDWVMQMNEAAYKFLFNRPLHQRKNWTSSYDLTFTMADGQEVVLHHKVTPHQLCKNGNMWLGLCYVVASSSKKNSKKATLFNSETKERYSFVDGEFVLFDNELISQEELQILRHIIKGYTNDEMCIAFGSTLTALKGKKQRLFDKLEVANSANAVHEANLRGLI